MVRAIYPGSFDPLFSVEERVNILKEVTADIPNVKIETFSGLSVNFARNCDAKVIIRGLRAITDFEYELQMAQTNRVLAKDVDTMFLTTSLEYAYLSSTTVKEAAYFGADISKFAPEYVVEKVREKFAQKGNKIQ